MPKTLFDNRTRLVSEDIFKEIDNQVAESLPVTIEKEDSISSDDDGKSLTLKRMPEK